MPSTRPPATQGGNKGTGVIIAILHNKATATKDAYVRAYDRNSTRTYKQNTQASTMSELYGYDNLNPLTAMDRGTLNANKDGITGTAAREEDWTLDPTGNWTGYLTKTTGTTDLDQTRSHNQANEIDTDNNHANTPGNAISGGCNSPAAMLRHGTLTARTGGGDTDGCIHFAHDRR